MRTPLQPSREQLSLVTVLHALSDPIRLGMVRTLARCDEATCSGLAINKAKSSLSHHFKVLRDAGVIHTRTEGTQHFNSLRRADLDQRFPGLLNAVLRAAGRMGRQVAKRHA